MQFDAIVVGAGVGGATVARELSARRRRVLILERGTNAPLKASLLGMAPIIHSPPIGDRMKAMGASTTGGATALYFAIAALPPLESFQELGIDLSGELESAKQELPLAVLPDELLGVQGRKLTKSALELGLPWEKRPMMVYQSRCESGYCREAKWSARAFVDEAMCAGAQLVTEATVRRVIVENKRAVGVEYTHGNRTVQRAYGAKVVLSAGALDTPMLLRSSGIRHVGSRGFHCEPTLGVVGSVPGLNGKDSFAGSTGMDFKDGIGFGDASVPRLMYQGMIINSRKFSRLFSHSSSLAVGVSVRDDSSGTLHESGRLEKKLSQEDKRKLQEGEAIARAILKNAGAKHLFTSALRSARISGLVRIQEHTDDKLETELRNLYVCDGSVLPDSVATSPALTIICLGKYLARRIENPRKAARQFSDNLEMQDAFRG